MKICVAQTRPVKGDIQRNMAQHKKWIEAAVAGGADIIIFPELSITGYEPELAQELATHLEDNQFNDFQEISDAQQLTIGVGMPIKNEMGIVIGMILFQPNQARQLYAKKYLHPDEEPFFIRGESTVSLIGNENNIALAICYELSVPEHSTNAHKSGAQIYIASVAKTADGVEKAAKTLSDIAKNYSMTVLMSNCLGYCDNFESAGKTAVWNNHGTLAGQLNDVQEGILIFDTNTKEVIEITS
jgi:predicted amidohydrolase